MTCNEIQEMILTDYLDDELDIQKKKYLKAHLSGCRHCQEYEEFAKQASIEPFVNLEKMSPPDRVWSQIKNSIEAKQDVNFIDIFLEKLKPLTLFYKPAFVFSVIAAVSVGIILIRVFLPSTSSNQVQVVIKNNIEEQNGYYDYLDSDEITEYGADYGTSIESYFL